MTYYLYGSKRVAKRLWACVKAERQHFEHLLYYYYYYYKCQDYSAAITQLRGGGTLQNLHLKLLHSSIQTSANHQSGQRQVSHMTDEKK